MKDMYKKLILVVLAIAVLVGSWYLIISPIRDETASINSQISTRRTYYNQLLEKEANRQQYIDDTEAYQVMYDQKMDEFPSNLDQEYQIEFVQGIRNNENIDYDVNAQGMAEETAFYTLGGTNSEGTVSDTEETDTETTESAAADGYTCYTSAMTLSYTGSYAGVKAFVDYVASYKYRMTIDSVSVSLGDNEDEYVGSMTVNLYSIVGGDRDEHPDIDVDDIDTGVDNLFTSGSASASVSKYAEDNGAAIESDYDIYVTLNPSSSDTSAKIVGLKSGGATVTSSKNTSEVMTVQVSQEGDVYTVVYGIGADTQTQEFEPGEDLTMLIQSSELKDDSDANAISLSIENTSDMTLYVKVADDSSANRVKITNKAGSVIVYK